MCNNVRNAHPVLKVFSYAFTSYSGLIVALHKCTGAHKYWILVDWHIARLLRITSKSFQLFLNGRRPWCNPLEDKPLTRNERIKFAALEQQLQR